MGQWIEEVGLTDARQLGRADRSDSTAAYPRRQRPGVGADPWRLDHRYLFLALGAVKASHPVVVKIGQPRYSTEEGSSRSLYRSPAHRYCFGGDDCFAPLHELLFV